MDVQPSLPFESAPVQAFQASAPALVFVRHPRARRYVIRIGHDGTIRVTIPRRGSKHEAQSFVEKQWVWIQAERVRVAEGRRRAREAISTDRARERRARARLELPARLLALGAQHGLTVTRVSVRNQRWRWGSCSRGGHICLNWRLVAIPDWVRDYVLVHELMHLKRMDHSQLFWKLVAQACPEYREARAWLRAHELMLSQD